MPIRVTYPSVWKLYDWYVLSLKGCQWLMDVKTVDKDRWHELEEGRVSTYPSSLHIHRVGETDILQEKKK